MYKKLLGDYGEVLAVQYLIDKEYKIIETKFRCKTGEIDIIASKDEYIAFIEVKYRRSLEYGYPREAVTKAKQRSIKKAAMFYIMINNLVNTDFRFDVIEIIETGELLIEHIENAFY